MTADSEIREAARLHAWLREVDAVQAPGAYNGVYAGHAGDSSAADNQIDSVIAPSDQLSPGSGGVLRAIGRDSFDED